MNATRDVLYEDIKRTLGVGDEMATALLSSRDEDWQIEMIERYGGDLSAWKKDDLAARIRPDDTEAFK
jgi:hypothetical protein